MAETIPFGQYMPDVSDLNTPNSKFLSNVLPRSDGYGPFKDFGTFTGALPSACRGYFYARKTDGSIQTFAATDTRLYRMDNTTFAWTDISKGGVAYPAVSQTAQWQFAQFNNFIIAVQANVVPQVFDLTTSTAFADLGGTPPQAAYISIINRFVVLSGLLSFPYRIQWSGLNAPATWTSGITYSDFQDFPDGGVVRGVVGGELGIIMQDSAIRRMMFSPGSDIVFQIDRLAKDKGVLAPYSLVTMGEKIFFLSAQGFMKSDASGSLVPIGTQRVDETFFKDYDDGHPEFMIGSADPASNVCIWAYKSKSAGSLAGFDKLLCYNWLLDKWTPITMSGQYLSSLAKPGITLEGLNTISASIDDLPFSLDSLSTSTLPSISMMNLNNIAGFFTGSNLEATIETSEISMIERRMNINGVYPVTDASSVFASIEVRELLTDPLEQYSPETAREIDGKCPFLVNTRYARAKLRIPYGTNWTYATGVLPDMSAAGR